MKIKILTLDLIRLAQKILKNESIYNYQDFRNQLKIYLNDKKQLGKIFSENPKLKNEIREKLDSRSFASSTLHDLFEKAQIEYDRDSKRWHYVGDINKQKKNILQKMAKSKIVHHPSPVMCFFENKRPTDSQYLATELENAFPEEIIGSFFNYHSFMMFFKDQESADKVMLEIDKHRVSSEKPNPESN